MQLVPKPTYCPALSPAPVLRFTSSLSSVDCLGRWGEGVCLLAQIKGQSCILLIWLVVLTEINTLEYQE